MLKTAIQNLQAIGQYYEFSDVDVDRYRIDRALRQVISARGVRPRNLDASAQTWVNLHLAYTHGYGVVAAQVNRAGTSGRPDFVVSGFDQQAAIPVRQPRIYFGEPHQTRPPMWWSAPGRRVDSPSVSGQGADVVPLRPAWVACGCPSRLRRLATLAFHGPGPADLQQPRRPLKDPVQPGHP